MVFHCEFVTFPLVFWVRCGTWLYLFLIFAPLLTFITWELMPAFQVAHVFEFIIKLSIFDGAYFNIGIKQVFLH